MLELIITLALVGFICWLVLQIPMPEPFPKIIIGIVCVCLILFLLDRFGIYHLGHIGSIGLIK